MKKKNKALLITGCAAAVLTAFSLVACDHRMVTENYTIKTAKVSAGIRIVFITDLHNSLYGKGQQKLINAVEEANPDIIIFGGDIADKTQRDYPKNSYIIAKYLGEKYPCFYSMGNHEYARGDSELIKKQLGEYGIKVLEGSGEVIKVNGQEIEVCGIFDPYTYFECDGEYISQLDAVTAKEYSTRYRILTAHFPEDIDQYVKGGFDLVLSGHAHGGQVRLPLILEGGLYSPGQGFFPKYANGMYIHGDTVQIVSRGLWKPSTVIAVPRVFNRPELTIADIIPIEN